MAGTDTYDTLILGAGGAGMMCAAYAAARGGQVLIVDHAKNPGEKIRISGGGRCNFTNLHTGPGNFLSENPHFAKSALKRYSQWDFLDLVGRYGIAYHEKTLGQLFCDTSAKEIIEMLRQEMDRAGVSLRLNTHIGEIAKTESGFTVRLEKAGDVTQVRCRHLVVATGGKSIPKMGATGLGYQIAEQFGHRLTPTRAGLVPLTFGEEAKAEFATFSGLAVEAQVVVNGTGFKEALLFTHRGLSGPAILQASSYWCETQPITVTLLPEQDLFQALRSRRQENGRRAMATVLAEFLPKRLASYFAERGDVAGNLADISDKRLQAFVQTMAHWQLFPVGTEGYRTAEVTLGGVATETISSKTMQSVTVPGLYFIGEVVDVTGWLGGYNFQWAWSSGWAAGTAIAARP